MKKLHLKHRQNNVRKVATTVSAAALMLGVSHAATVAMHFQDNYCGGAAYSGYPVTITAFGVAPSGWQNLLGMPTGYGCSPALGFPYTYSLNETIDTTTSSNGLNPLPNGSLSVTWTANTANYTPFYGYAGNPPTYTGGRPLQNPTTGEQQVYATFLRDGVNFGPPGGADNAAHPGGYVVDITGLKSVFTNTPFVVELMASSDSMQDLTNAFVIDMVGLTTNSVTYPSTPPVSDAGNAPWVRGNGGGLSTGSATINTDHIKIISNTPQHGGTGGPPTGYDHAGTIAGFIITDKPVVSMSPQSVAGNPGDSVALSMYAVGVQPLGYQWRRNGHAIAGATTTAYNIASLGLSNEGNYDVVVTNAYGSATSAVSVVTGGNITMTPISGIVVDSQPANAERNGIDHGATWLASSSDGSKNRSGVMQFVATNNTGITVPGSTNFDSSMGTLSFWMRSAGTDMNANGSVGAAVFGRPGSTLAADLMIAQQDGGFLLFNAPGTATIINSAANVSDNHWHFIVVTYDQSVNGGAALYIDGALDTTNSNVTTWSSSVGQEYEFGFTTGQTLRAYNGLLDDLRVYNRQLTAAEVTSVFNTGALIDTAALQMELNFDTAPVSGYSLTWNAANSVLQSNPSISGAFSDVPGAISPYNIVPKAGQKFYQFRYPSVAPQARISNPFLM